MGKMKANRKFVNGEEAVSAVIGVILMVAITVAIAATVYVYVSGMLPGPSSGNKSVGAILTSSSDSSHQATFKVTQTDAGIPWAEVTCKWAWQNGSGAQSYAYTATTNWDAPNTVTVAVGDYFKANFTRDGTWIIDLVYKDHIIWTSPAVTINAA